MTTRHLPSAAAAAAAAAAAPILVTAATGKTGRRVADRLERAGAVVRRGSRRGQPAFDWNDPATWDAALAGCSAAYVAFVPDLAIPGAVDVLRLFVDRAVRAGLSRLVLLSGRGEPAAQAGERVVQASGLAWTVVRAGWFDQNFDEGAFAGMVRDGVVALPDPGVGEPFVDADDIADVAGAALLEDGHDGQVYELTGPRLLTLAEAVAEIAAASGRPIRFQPISMEAFRAGLAEQHVPPVMIDLLAELVGIWGRGGNARVADGVQRALGRPARDFRQYCRDAAASGAWAGAEALEAAAAGEEVARG